jgi:hypothetical protein
MKLSDLQQEIAVIEQQLQGLLDEGGRQAVQQAKRDLERLAAARNGRRGKKKRKPVVPWRLTIPHGNPLRFIPTMPTVGVRHQLIVDLFCSLSEPDHGLPSGEHNIVLRLWSEDDALWFREGLDAAPLWDQIVAAGGRRVMHRVHFDYASPTQPGPQFHWQIGGTQHGSEFCWFPSTLELPRFPHHPLSLITACEFVVRTFFPREYGRIAAEPTWIHAVKTAQQAYLEPYLRSLLTYAPVLNLPNSVLERLWNPHP